MRELKNKLTNKLKNTKGFTLVEMIVVIAIIAILIALIAPNVATLIKDAQDTKGMANAKSIFSSASAWSTKHTKDGFSFQANPSLKSDAGLTDDDITVLASTGATVDADTRGLWTKTVTPAGGTATQEPTTVQLFGGGNAYLPLDTVQAEQHVFMYFTDAGVCMAVVVTDPNLKITGVAGSINNDDAGLTTPDQQWGSSIVGLVMDPSGASAE
jgi:prepilin-type N-terminal cleavage/methylation domain-containing protein